MNPNAESYDRIAEEWASYRKDSPVNLCVREAFSSLPKGSSILDIGCGTGHPIDEYLLDEGYLVTGIDFSSKMLSYTEDLKELGGEFYCLDFLDYKTERRFDGILAFDSLWHLRKEDQERAYRKVASFLKPGGIFLFTAGKSEGESQGEMFGQPFTYSSLDYHKTFQILKEEGLVILSYTLDYKEKTTGSRDFIALAKRK